MSLSRIITSLCLVVIVIPSVSSLPPPLSTAATTTPTTNNDEKTSSKRTLTFLSGSSLTTQTFLLSDATTATSTPTTRDDVPEPTIMVTRHHYVCYHRGTPKSYSPSKSTAFTSSSASTSTSMGDSFQDPLDASAGRTKCCRQLYADNLLPFDFQQSYCLDRIAVLPDYSDKLSRRKERGVRPVFYLARDEMEVVDSMNMTTTTMNMTTTYRQRRQIKVMDQHKEKDRLWDMPRRGIEAYSPFHLGGFMNFMVGGCGSSHFGWNSVNSGETSPYSASASAPLPLGEGTFPMDGRVEGRLSKEGGMHRSFWHEIRLFLEKGPPTCHDDDNNNLGSCNAARDPTWKMNINATTLLPLMQDVFIDADDPLIVEYGGEDSSNRGVSCRVSLEEPSRDDDGNNNFETTNSSCHIQFISSETIDIEQPSFASRQYVVAFRVDAYLELIPSSGSTSSSSQTSQTSTTYLDSNPLEVIIRYGTTLHTRYPSPIDIHHNTPPTKKHAKASQGTVPIAIEPPSLYSAGIRLHPSDGDAREYVLRTHAPAPGRGDGPIVLRVAAGATGDYRWVAFVTLAAALVGGVVLVRSLDSVSVWD